MKLQLLKLFDRIIGWYLNIYKKITTTQLTPTAHKNPTKIAIIKLSAMGDALCLMPAIRQLKQWHPQAEITFVTTSRTNPSLFTPLTFIDHIQIIPTSLALIGFILGWRKNTYDLCIDADQYYNLSHWLSLQCQYAVGFHTPSKPRRLNNHLFYDLSANEKTQFFKLIALACNKTITATPEPTLPELLSPQIIKNAQTTLAQHFPQDISNKPIIVIYPGSSSNASFRRWPIDNYKKIIDTLCQQGHTIAIAGGPDELAIKDQFSQLATKYPNCHNLINELKLTDWLYLMQNHAKLFIGNDSGLLHIAEAAGTPIIGIFGPNIHSKWGSLNKLSKGIEIPIKNLNCRPCIVSAKGEIPSKCQRGDTACLTRISPNKVLESVKEMLK
jgi:ADP-heptose:LPS heptosyltransferase